MIYFKYYKLAPPKAWVNFKNIMAEETIHGVPIEIQDSDSHTIQQVIHSWKEHKSDFETMRHGVDHDSNNKIHIGNTVFEKRDGKYILRHSTQSF